MRFAEVVESVESVKVRWECWVKHGNCKSGIVCKFVESDEGYFVKKTTIWLVMIGKSWRGQI